MGKHDDYGKEVLIRASKGNFKSYGRSIEISYGTDHPARIDGTIGKSVAVEVESRTDKQVRGAVLDLICHPFPKKLLVLLPVHMNKPESTKIQCENILKRFIDPKMFRVVLFVGTGNSPDFETDTKMINTALLELDFPNN